MMTNHCGQSNTPTLRSGYFKIMATANHVSGLPKRTSKSNPSETATFIVTSSAWLPSISARRLFYFKVVTRLHGILRVHHNYKKHIFMCFYHAEPSQSIVHCPVCIGANANLSWSMLSC